MNTQANNDIENYKKIVDSLSKHHINQEFYNNSAEHAIAILSTLIRNAKERVCIIAKDFNNTVTNSDDYIDAVLKFIRKDNTKLQVVITDPKLENNWLLYSLFRSGAYSNDRIEIKSSNGCVMRNNQVEVNYSFADDCMYRFEYDIERNKALCNFGDVDMVKKLNDAFDKFFNRAENTIILPEHVKIA